MRRSIFHASKNPDLKKIKTLKMDSPKGDYTRRKGLVFFTDIYIYIYIPQAKLVFRGSYLVSIVILLVSRIACRQVPKPRCLSPAADALVSRIAGRQVPKPSCR